MATNDALQRLDEIATAREHLDAEEAALREQAIADARRQVAHAARYEQEWSDKHDAAQAKLYELTGQDDAFVSSTDSPKPSFWRRKRSPKSEVEIANTEEATAILVVPTDDSTTPIDTTPDAQTNNSRKVRILVVVAVVAICIAIVIAAAMVVGLIWVGSLEAAAWLTAWLDFNVPPIAVAMVMFIGVALIALAVHKIVRRKARNRPTEGVSS